MKIMSYMKTIKLNKTAVILIAAFVVIELMYLSYRSGVSHTKMAADQSCLLRAEELFEARKSEFQLKFCEMPPPVQITKDCYTQEDN